MTETRAPYHFLRPPKPTRIAYPGSKLEIIVEALDEIAELTPDAYPLRVNAIHTGLRATLEGEIEPAELLAYLMETSQPT